MKKIGGEIISDKTKEEGIKADIRQGKEYEVLAVKWETTEDYIKKIASEMKKAGERLPDRRNEEWKRIQILRKKDIEGEE